MSEKKVFDKPKEQSQVNPETDMMKKGRMKTRIILSTVLLGAGLIATVSARQSFVSIVGIALAIIGMWMLRKAITEQRKAKEGTRYQRLEPEATTTDTPPTTEAKATESETGATSPASLPTEMETIRDNATETLLKYALEVDMMVGMGTSDDLRKVTVENDYLVFERKVKDKTTMNTIKMMPEMMANLAMVQMLRHDQILDVVDAAYFTGKGVKTVWFGDDDAKAEMVFSHASFDRVFSECGHTPDKSRFLTQAVGH